VGEFGCCADAAPVSPMSAIPSAPSQRLWIITVMAFPPWNVDPHQSIAATIAIRRDLFRIVAILINIDRIILAETFVRTGESGANDSQPRKLAILQTKNCSPVP
jgi:hypothetical protein